MPNPELGQSGDWDREAEPWENEYAARLNAEIAAQELGRGLEWALYWIGRCAEVPLPLEEQDEWQRWAEARAALRRWGPESDAGVDRTLRRSGIKAVRITHGRHCACSACAREDWTNPEIAPCGMHGSACARSYQPLGLAGSYA